MTSFDHSPRTSVRLTNLVDKPKIEDNFSRTVKASNDRLHVRGVAVCVGFAIGSAEVQIDIRDIGLLECQELSAFGDSVSIIIDPNPQTTVNRVSLVDHAIVI